MYFLVSSQTLKVWLKGEYRRRRRVKIRGNFDSYWNLEFEIRIAPTVPCIVILNNVSVRNKTKFEF